MYAYCTVYTNKDTFCLELTNLTTNNLQWQRHLIITIRARLMLKDAFLSPYIVCTYTLY